MSPRRDGHRLGGSVAWYSLLSLGYVESGPAEPLQGSFQTPSTEAAGEGTGAPVHTSHSSTFDPLTVTSASAPTKPLAHSSPVASVVMPAPPFCKIFQGEDPSAAGPQPPGRRQHGAVRGADLGSEGLDLRPSSATDRQVTQPPFSSKMS